ncbi:MAG: tRNA epoxyqueuosine(34) reductase QueG [Pirellulales bacterium]|nr:tRNA epoxyqueuosine(34) reductase QueG [Pirellulales bacterium]
MSPNALSTADPATLAADVKAEARRLGFSLVGVCPAIEPTGFPRLVDWLAAGHAGEMRWIGGRLEAYRHPRHVLDGVRSLVMLAMPYGTVEPRAAGVGQGRVSRYAWGVDYHDLVRERLHALADYLRGRAGGCLARGVVDTAPLLEREFAQLAGLGWIGKNTLLLNREAGSWFFLAALLTDAELTTDAPFAADHCGTCRACLDACPTGAFTAPYVLDSRRCISYLTIELDGPVPHDLRAGLGDWLFGCDICQEVCPWNNHAPADRAREFSPTEGSNPVELTTLFDLDDEAFRRRYRRTPLWRARRRGLLRNAALVLGNQPVLSALPALTRGLDDIEPLVRGACAWALGQLARAGIKASAARSALEARQASETDAAVCGEIRAALLAN